MKINLCPREESVSNLPESLDIVSKNKTEGRRVRTVRAKIWGTRNHSSSQTFSNKSLVTQS